MKLLIALIFVIAAAVGTYAALIGLGIIPAAFDAQAIAELPFESRFSVDAKKGEAGEADSYSVFSNSMMYTEHGATMVDIGDVRLVLEGWNNHRSHGSVRLLVDTNVPSRGAEFGHMSGRSVALEHQLTAAGVTHCTMKTDDHPDFLFSLEKMKITIGSDAATADTIPLGQGKKIAYFTSDGVLQDVELLDNEPAKIDRTAR